MVMRLSADNGQCVWPLGHEACDWCEGVKMFLFFLLFFILLCLVYHLFTVAVELS